MRTHVDHQADVTIISDSTEDMAALSAAGLHHVVDPMIFRTAEVFVNGPPAAGQDSAAVWEAVSDNLTELVGFFDLLVYSEKLPMIDYGATFHETFDKDGGFRAHSLYNYCNDGPDGQALYSVHIQDTEDSAKAATDWVKAHRPLAGTRLATGIGSELLALDHAWRPKLVDLDERYDDYDYQSPQRSIDTFLYGGMLFGALADSAKGAHVLQSKRGRLLAAAGVASPQEPVFSDDEFFRQLDETFDAAAEQRNVARVAHVVPPVLPYLLTKEPRTPRELLQAALDLRASGPMKAFSQWRSDLLADWADHGRIDASVERDFSVIARQIERTLSPAEVGDASMNWRAYLLQAVPVGRVWDWAMPNAFPSRNHMKLLLRLQLAARPRAHVDLYKSLEQSLHTMWERSEPPPG